MMVSSSMGTRGSKVMNRLDKVFSIRGGCDMVGEEDSRTDEGGSLSEAVGISVDLVVCVLVGT